MSPYAKFGLDRPNCLAGHRLHTDRQINRHNAFYMLDMKSWVWFLVWFVSWLQKCQFVKFDYIWFCLISLFVIFRLLTLERLNGSFLTHSELHAHATQHPVTVEWKHFMTFIAFWGRMHSRSSMIISNTLAELQQEIPRKPEWVIFDPCRNKGKHNFYTRFCKLFYIMTPVLE